MKILHINPFYHPFVGGTEKYLYGLCTRLAKHHEVSVVTSRLKGTPKIEVIDGVKVYRVPSLVLERLPAPLPPPYSHTFPPFLIKACLEEQPDVLHLHNRFFPTFASVAFWKRFVKKPLFLTIHNARAVGISPSTDFFGQFYDAFFGNLVIRSADFIIANSKWGLDVTVPKDYPQEKTRVIYNGVDTHKYKHARSGVADELGCEHYSVTVCRLVPQKGVEYWLCGLALLVKNLRLKPGDFKAVIIGRGPDRQRLEKLASQLGVKEHVVLAGFVPENKMREYYSGAHFSVLPSLYEPFGIVLAESMACNTPCITTRVGGIPEVVADTGLFVQPRSPAALARAASRLLTDASLRKRFSKKARQRVVKHFDWNVLAKQVEGCYEEFLRKKS